MKGEGSVDCYSYLTSGGKLGFPAEFPLSRE